jgi:hypothetical protein
MAVKSNNGRIGLGFEIIIADLKINKHKIP